MVYGSLLFPGVIGLIGLIAITLSQLIDRPAPTRNFIFSFLIVTFALAYITEMTKNDSMQFWVFKLGFTALIILASLVGAYTEFVLAVIHRGYLRPAFLSGLLAGMTAFFMGHFLPSSNLGYQEIHDIPFIIRSIITLVVAAGSYILFCVLTDAENNANSESS
jgi:hypothetical protein